MGALTGRVSLLIKKCYVVWGGSILPRVSWSRVAYFVVLLTVLGCVDLATSFSVLSIEGFLVQGLESSSKCDKYLNTSVELEAACEESGVIKSLSSGTCTSFSWSIYLLTFNFFTCCWSASSLLCPCHSEILSQMNASRTVLDVSYGLYTAYSSSKCFDSKHHIAITQSGLSVVCHN